LRVETDSYFVLDAALEQYSHSSSTTDDLLLLNVLQFEDISRLMTFYVMIITDVEVLVGSSKAVGTVHDITGSKALISDAPSARYLY
jgi:hypothetical protein